MNPGLSGRLLHFADRVGCFIRALPPWVSASNGSRKIKRESVDFVDFFFSIVSFYMYQFNVICTSCWFFFANTWMAREKREGAKTENKNHETRVKVFVFHRYTRTRQQVKKEENISSTSNHFQRTNRNTLTTVASQIN